MSDLFCPYREQLRRHPHQEVAIHGPWHGQQQTRAASQGITAPHLLSLPFPTTVSHSLTYILAPPLSSLPLHLHLSLLHSSSSPLIASILVPLLLIIPPHTSFTMANIIKSALPTHLKPNTGDEQGNERRHGKTRSHMVSPAQSFTL